MKSFQVLVSLALLLCLQAVTAFTAPQIPSTVSTATASSTSLGFGPFGQPKDDGKPGDYVCKVGGVALKIGWFDLVW